MLFKNLLVYRISPSLTLDEETLEAALANLPAKPCGSQTASTYGFTAPTRFADEPPLVHACQGFLLVAGQLEERLLPGSVVRDAVAEKVSEIETAESRKVYKKEKDQIKDVVVQELLPRAFIRKSHTFAAIDPKTGLLYVDSSSTGRAEELLSAMREALGSLPVRPVSVKQAPDSTFTAWLKDGDPGHSLSLLDECELRDSAEDGGIIRIKREDLASEEIQNLLATGKLATVVTLGWDDKLTFQLDTKLAIKKLRFADLLLEQAEQDAGDDDAAGLFDASFILMMLTLREFMPALFEALGGVEEPENIV
ncbi:MAG: recombination-associated protein RdgC [Thiopseudomonas sp.]